MRKKNKVNKFGYLKYLTETHADA